MEKTKLYSSGNTEIDDIRRDILKHSTNEGNYKLRIFLLKQWVCTLQQQGANLEEYLPVAETFAKIFLWNLYPNNSNPQVLSEENKRILYKTTNKGYRILNKIQRQLGKEEEENLKAMDSVSDEPKPKRSEVIDWPMYQGNKHHTGFTSAPGPDNNETAWKFPVGLAWESRPVVEEDRVYVVSPGMRTILYCLDKNSGETIWETKQLPEIVMDQLYWTPSISSSPIVLKDKIVVREMGSRGNKGHTKNLVYIDKKSGNILDRVTAGHVDYRAGYAPVEGNDDFIVFPHGVQDIEQIPPINQPFNRIICKDTKNGNTLWDYNLGHIFSEPLLDGNEVVVGTLSGSLFCLNIVGQFESSSLRMFPTSPERIKWQFKANGGINKKVAAKEGCIYFGSNDGCIYCLDRESGELLWKYEVDEKEDRAFKHFSTPNVEDGKLYIGAADKILYCLDAENGDLIWKYKTSDWIRSMPACYRDKVYTASTDGMLYCLKQKNSTINLEWKKKIGTHQIYADLTLCEGNIFTNTSDLYLWCLNEDGTVRWKQSLIKCFYKGEQRILTEQIAGGGYFQSKPTAAEGKVFLGTPSRFIYALDAETGSEIWKSEMGGAISASPVYSNGKIFAGQQGGEDFFYCLDAREGKQQWKQSVGWVWGSANISNGKVFVPGIDGFVNCLSEDDGSILWRYRTARSTCTEPVIDDNMVYFGGWDHYLYAFDMESGKIKWQIHLGGGADSGAPIAYEGKIYLPVGGNLFRCLDGKTGDVLWQFTIDKVIFNASPAFHDGKIFISVQQGRGLGGIAIISKIYCLDARTGSIVWSHNGGGLTGPVVSNGKVYFGSTTSPYFYCVDEKGNSDGTTTCYWKYKMENKVEESCPAIYNNKAYILSSGGYLYAIK